MCDNDNIIYWSEVKKEIKKKRIKDGLKEAGVKVVDTAKAGIEYVEEHKEGAALVAAGIGGTAKLLRHISKKHQEHKQSLTYYDHSTGEYMKMKRPLKNKEKIQAYDRHQNGEKYTDIYRSMGVL